MPKERQSPDRPAGIERSAFPGTDELTIGVSGAEALRASEWLAAGCRRRNVPPALAERLALCLHEVLANVISHGGGTAPIRLSLEVGLEQSRSRAGVTVSDAGLEFNPLSVPERVLPKTLGEATAGGLGLVMIRRCSDWLDYRREDGRNHLTFGARWNHVWRAPEPPMKSPAVTHFRRGPDRRVETRAVAEERRRDERRAAAMQWIRLFEHADQRDLEEALVDCEVLLLPRGTPLLRTGEANRSVLILLSGRLVAQLGTEPNPDTAIEILPGECVGELSAIDGKPISALVLAVSDVRVLKLDREVFWNRLMHLRGVAENLMVTLTERMRRSNEKALALQREQLELHHLRKELELARQLQASLLPLQRPLFPGRSDIEVCGFMEPASKVGGDLFDAFFVDNRTLFVCIGDVSGHGIAAALFMVRVIGLLRSLAMDTMQPEKVLETLNDRLCIDNDANMFVTLFCGFLDVQSRNFVYANGGHCAPMVCAGRDAALLPLPPGTLAGAMAGRRYGSLQRKLAAGETLLCYTDGVTEAENPAGVPFSEEGCLELLRGGAGNPLPALLDALRDKVVSHAGSKMLADDCTMLALRLR